MLGTTPPEINSAYTDPCAPKPTMPTLYQSLTNLLISGFTASGPRPIVTASNAGIAHPDVKVALLCPYIGRQHKMATIVPANDHPLLSLVTEDADRCRGEREEPASLRG